MRPDDGAIVAARECIADALVSLTGTHEVRPGVFEPSWRDLQDAADELKRAVARLEFAAALQQSHERAMLTNRGVP